MKKTEKSLYPIFARNFSAFVEENDGRYVFADMIEVTYDSVRRWCNGEGLPTGTQLLKISEIYKVSIDWLLTGKYSSGAMQDWHPEIQEACRAVKKILESKDKTTALALKTNISAFEQSLTRHDDNEKLKKDIDKLKKEFNHLKKVNEPGRRTGTD